MEDVVIKSVQDAVEATFVISKQPLTALSLQLAIICFIQRNNISKKNILSVKNISILLLNILKM